MKIFLHSKPFRPKFYFALLALYLSVSHEVSATGMPASRLNMIDAIPPVDSADRKVFEKVEVEATFPGGEPAWRAFLQQNLNANTPVDNGAPAGTYTVWIEFIVGKDGKVSDLKMLTHNGYGMETELMRILRMAPNWVPATQNGRGVRAYRKQPVTFVVQDAKRGRHKNH